MTDNPVRHRLAAWTEIQGSAMVITAETSVLHEFNETGTYIWQHLTGEHTLQEIAQMLVEEFDVPPAQAQADVSKFVARLLEDKLIESVPEVKNVGIKPDVRTGA
jgi:hypothetical protein